MTSRIGKFTIKQVQKGDRYTITIECPEVPTTVLKYNTKTFKLTGEAVSWADMQGIIKSICKMGEDYNTPITATNTATGNDPKGKVVHFGNITVHQQLGESCRDFYARCTAVRKQNNIGFRKEAQNA